jgi:hypothetical protein
LQSLDERASREYVNPAWRAVIPAALGRAEEALDNIESLEGTVNATSRSCACDSGAVCATIRALRR